MWPSLPQQKTCHFSIHEGENIDMGTANIEIAEFLLNEEVFHDRSRNDVPPRFRSVLYAHSASLGEYDEGKDG